MPATGTGYVCLLGMDVFWIEIFTLDLESYDRSSASNDSVETDSVLSRVETIFRR